MLHPQDSNGRRTVLASIKPGCSAAIGTLEEINPLLRRRLCDLGVAEGSLIKVLRLGPFGGPLTFECSGQHIGIRREEACRMEVLPL